MIRGSDPKRQPTVCERAAFLQLTASDSDGTKSAPTAIVDVLCPAFDSVQFAARKIGTRQPGRLAKRWVCKNYHRINENSMFNSFVHSLIRCIKNRQLPIDQVNEVNNPDPVLEVPDAWMHSPGDPTS